MADKTIEDMRQELEDAGYVIELQKPSGHSRATEPEYGWVYSDLFSSSEERFFIPYVYRHLQEKRRAAEMERLLTEMLDGPNFEYVLNWKEEIKTLLGKD